MAGMLYLPRLFVYHCAAPVGSPQSETFKVMERRLLKAIINPAMIASFVFGIWLLVLEPGWFQQGWLHAKLTFVVGLLAVHGMLAKARKTFEADRNTRSATYYRVINEVPTVLMIGIVIFVIVKPF
nr:protoporphyrinogen oxidase HemJ [Azospirillum oleiclasticum]